MDKPAIEALTMRALRNASAGGDGFQSVTFGDEAGGVNSAMQREVVASTRGVYRSRPRRSSVAFSAVVLDGVVGYVTFDPDGRPAKCFIVGPGRWVISALVLMPLIDHAPGQDLRIDVF